VRMTPFPVDEDTAGVLRRDRALIVGAFVVVAGLFAWRVGPGRELPAFVGFALVASALVVCDVRLRRLPDALTLPAYPLLAVLLLLPFERVPYTRALIAMAVMFVVHFTLALFADGIGFGDVKAAGLVGLVTGWLSWAALAQTLVVGYVCMAGYAITLLVVRRAERGTLVPFGPSLLGAAVLVIALHGS